MTRKFIGRGNKAPYETATMRVPKALHPLVDKLCHEYRAKVRIEANEVALELYSSKTLQEAIEECKKIVKQKKGAKVSLEKLLQILYETEVKLD